MMYQRSKRLYLRINNRRLTMSNEKFRFWTQDKNSKYSLEQSIQEIIWEKMSETRQPY